MVGLYAICCKRCFRFRLNYIFQDTKEITVEGETRRIYLDSSHENLGAIHDDVRRRRRSLGFSESDVY